MRILVYKNGTVVSAHDVLSLPLTIGRSKLNNIVLPDSAVSREHAKFYMEDEKLIFEDLKSNNGSFYKGKKVDRMEVQVGDTITMGEFELVSHDSKKFDPERTVFGDENLDPTSGESHSLPEEFVNEATPRPNSELTEHEAPDPKLSVLQNFLKAERAHAPIENSIPRLVRLDGPEVGESIPLLKSEITLGRATTNDVVVEEPEVSIAHAIIENTGNKFVIKNHDNSTNTFIDGVPIRERELESHDIVEIGSSHFEFVQGTSRSRVEPSRVFERAPTTTISRYASKLEKYKPYLSDWRVLAAFGAVLGVSLVYVIQPTPVPEAPLPVQMPTHSNPQNLKNSDEEKARLIRFGIDRAQKLFEQKKYDEAESRLNNLLDKLSPNNPEALALLQKVDQVRSVEEKEASEDESNFQNPKKKSTPNKKIKLSKKDNSSRLNKLYKTGISKYEKGSLSLALPMLQEVAETPGSHQKSAKNLIKEIEKRLKTKLKEKLETVQSLIDAGDLPEAYKEARPLAQKNPDSKEAFDLYKKVQGELETKSRKAYMEGITFLEVVEDRQAALERFQEALRLSPDPESRYYQKSKQKISELQPSSAP